MIRTTMAIVATAALLSSLPPAAAGSPPAPRPLPGSVPAAVASGRAQRTRDLAPDKVLHLAVVLRLRNQGRLGPVLDGVARGSRPAVSPGHARAVFYPTADTQSQVVDWLRSGGLQVERTYSNQVVVDAAGTAAQVSRLLHTSIHVFRGRIGGQERSFYANSDALQVPARLAGSVAAVLGVNDIPVFTTPMTSPIPLATSRATASAGPPYGPADFAGAYDVGPLWRGAADGRGQHIGITLWTQAPSDAALTRFASETGSDVATQGNGRLHVIKVDGGSTQADQGEAALDVEYASGMAPGASIDFYQADQATFASLTDALNAAGTATDAQGNPLDRQISSSWGAAEPLSSTADVAGMEQVLAANTLTGHTYLFSSGDNGSWADPSGCTGSDPWPDYPASSGYVTSVGGTRLAAPPDGTWPGETTWKYDPSGSTCGTGTVVPEGSGGGYSRLFSRPSWQTAVGLAATGKRAYPDVAADADPATGALVVMDGSSGVQLVQVGGTSLASPLWAGMTADLNTYLGANGLGQVGSLAPRLYALQSTTPRYPALHDITSGSNGSYAAGPGWDAVTGLGSPDLFGLARDLAGASGPVDTTRPSVALRVASSHGFLLGARSKLRWTGSDAGSGVASYDVRWRRATAAGTLGHWQYPSTWQRTSATSATGPQQIAGLRYCFAARARDRAGNVSPWSTVRCTSRVVDDRALATKTARWRRSTGDGYYRHTATVTSAKAQRLSYVAPAASRVGVLATVCARCGAVTVYQGSHRLGVLRLVSSTTRRKQLVLLPYGTTRTGRIRLVTNTARRVNIDGLALTTR